MTLSVYLTNSQKNKSFFASNNLSIIDDVFQNKGVELNNIDKEMQCDLSYSSKDIIKEIIVGKYKNRNSEFSFYYGWVYGVLCEYFGEKLNDLEYYNDNDVNFIYDKFPGEILKKKYYFPLPKFDFPDIISLENTDIELLQNTLNNIVEYKTEFINLHEKELLDLKNCFQNMINIAREKKAGLVFIIND